MYRLYQKPNETIKRKVQAGLLALAVTIGVPTMASLVYHYPEIFPGPSVIRSNEQAASEQTRPNGEEETNTREPNKNAVNTPEAPSQQSATPNGTNTTNRSTASTNAVPTLPVGGRGGGLAAPSVQSPSGGSGSGGGGTPQTGGGGNDCLCEDPIGAIQGTTNSLLSAPQQTTQPVTEPITNTLGGGLPL